MLNFHRQKKVKESNSRKTTQQDPSFLFGIYRWNKANYVIIQYIPTQYMTSCGPGEMSGWMDRYSNFRKYNLIPLPIFVERHKNEEKNLPSASRLSNGINILHAG